MMFTAAMLRSVTQKPTQTINLGRCHNWLQIFLSRISALIHFRLRGESGG
jgi:hypothetical protein